MSGSTAGILSMRAITSPQQKRGLCVRDRLAGLRKQLLPGRISEMIAQAYLHFMTLNIVHTDGPLITRKSSGINTRNYFAEINIPVGQIKFQARSNIVGYADPDMIGEIIIVAACRAERGCQSGNLILGCTDTAADIRRETGIVGDVPIGRYKHVLRSDICIQRPCKRIGQG